MNYRDDNTFKYDGPPKLGPKVEDLPEPIPDLAQQIAAEKQRRFDAQFTKAIRREFQKEKTA